MVLTLSAICHSQVGGPSPGPTQPRIAAPEGAVAAPGMSEGYFVANGASYYARNGQAFRVEREVSLRVLPNGMVGFDGQPLILPAGVMLTTDGRHAPIPRGINFRALPGAIPSGPEQAGVQPPPVSTGKLATEDP
jgi:hypothetical protein